ncbi:helix-turn-helix transcriptional regulator [Nocardia higoensis]|uniref:Helix-turn-helix transcriptional regulator n=1 Tax=Nocardia higoensis TaxID=228599 RepID=A0ABS0DKJ4_9NOCA|nr:helix-turn-helix transcriptional regulator [Nocardia higoensis]MBF6358082.1 helix-turn-helix transcriptional regulator [Nocardia higoensis]
MVERVSRDVNEALGRVVAERREEHGLTQRELWTAADMPKNSYVRLEKNQRDWTVNTLAHVAGILGASGSELLAEAEERAEREAREAAERERRARREDGGPWIAALSGD